MKNQRILITGGTGSLGREIARILSHENDIIIYSRNEERQFDMRQEFGSTNITYKIGDVRDKPTLLDAMKDSTIAIHAAAMKDTIICEDQPVQTYLNNIVGSNIFLEAVKESNSIIKACGVSTDKASSPSSVYGCTKYIMEQMFKEASRYTNTVISTVRFGNMIDSRGSLIKQWKKNPQSNISITHPEISRFFFKVNDAAKTVIKSIEKAKTGELYIKKMKAAKIIDILSLITGKDSFNIIGLFPGEKIHEELLSHNEIQYCHETEDYYIIKPGKKNNDPPKIYSTKNANYYSKEELKNLLEI